MSRLFVFDFDGTLVDTHRTYANMVKLFAEEHKYDHPCCDTIAKSYADSSVTDFGFGAHVPDHRKVMHASFDWIDVRTLQGHADAVPALFPHVADTLEDMAKAGHKLAIVTARRADTMHYILKQHRIDHLFVTHRTYDDFEQRGLRIKPEADQLTCVMRAVGNFDAGHTVVVGDTSMDMLMAKNAGAKSIGVTWGSHDADHLRAHGAHHVVDTHFVDVFEGAKRLFQL